MTAEKIVKLEGIGFIWSAVCNQWEVRFQELKEFKTEHGHCNVPHTKASGQLGNWVVGQRRQYKLLMDGKHSQITLERVQDLNSIGFEWSLLLDKSNKNWEMRFEELKECKTEHGHCNVPSASGQLGNWVGFQRRQYRFLIDGKTSTMTDERKCKLDSIGFEWRGKRVGRWDEHCGQRKQMQLRSRSRKTDTSEANVKGR